MAGLIGASIGALLVADPSLGWGVRGLHPAIALLPSAIGSFWGGYYLWNFYDAVPRGLRGVPLREPAASPSPTRPCRFSSAESPACCGATIVLSAFVVALGKWTHGTDTSAYSSRSAGRAALLAVGLLEAFSLHHAALMTTTVALATEITVRDVVQPHISGGALAAGAAVGVLLVLPILLVRLARSGGVLATTLWIQ